MVILLIIPAISVSSQTHLLEEYHIKYCIFRLRAKNISAKNIGS